MFNSFSLFLNSLFIISYILLFVKYFFKFFKNFLLDRKPLLKIFIQQLLYYIISLNFCQELFNFFWNFIFSSCSVLTVSNFYILSQIQVLVKNFFKFFWKTFWTSFFRSSVLFLLATFTSYHRWSCLSRTFFIFS